jgi:hypothetical protein
MKKLSFAHLYFPESDLNVADVLTSVGVSVKIGSSNAMHEILWAYSLGAFGGDKEQLDATPLISSVRINKSGLEDREAWTVEYYFNESDKSALDALVTSGAAGTESNIEVTWPDGSKETNTGVVTGNYITEVQVNGMLAARATVDLSGKWVHTPKT